MPTRSQTRTIFYSSSLAMLLAFASAQSLPPTETTQPAEPTAQTQPAQFTSPGRSATRARIDYAGNQLTVTAENSPLNAILHDIARATGMKITGTVSDERVFGTYGPATTHQVLNLLLDGASSNVLFREGPNHVVSELVLTPRTGAATPPNPNAAAAREETDLPPQLGGRRRGRSFDPNHGTDQANQPPNPQQPPSNLQPQPDQPQPSTDPNAQPSPNGVKTPSQIYEDLTRQQQPQQKQPPVSSPEI